MPCAEAVENNNLTDLLVQVMMAGNDYLMAVKSVSTPIYMADLLLLLLALYEAVSVISKRKAAAEKTLIKHFVYTSKKALTIFNMKQAEKGFEATISHVGTLLQYRQYTSIVREHAFTTSNNKATYIAEILISNTSTASLRQKTVQLKGGVYTNRMCSVIFLLVLAASPALISARLAKSYDNFPEESIVTLEETSLAQYITMDDTTEDILGTVNQLISRITALEKTIKHQCQKPVAFHAVRDGAEYAHLGAYQHIVFNTVLLNIGNGYNAHNGIFTAPKAGLYIFSASILSYNGPKTSAFAADIIKDGKTVLARVYGHGVNGLYDQGSATVVTQLKAGEQVWVWLFWTPNDSLYGGRYTTFSGSLISS
ncbi:uncharacterized protein LOC123539871 [Mercenaria mercenaria]|uniref:uncharacterized protein LOC123539871 n=1 Tax=Mercenaria mercenaria TaxID=6596 RepID=UPI00234E7469|nr:uncharacterized protein LOC123539871 [Mercenaria mercenaria]